VPARDARKCKDATKGLLACNQVGIHRVYCDEWSASLLGVGRQDMDECEDKLQRVSLESGLLSQLDSC